MRRPGFLGGTSYWFGEAPSQILYRRPLNWLVRPLVSIPMSVSAGRYYDSKASVKRIAPFVKKHQINMDDFSPSDIREYSSFNEFFARKLAPGARIMQPGFISPADSRVLVVPNLTEDTSFWIKRNKFKLSKLLSDERLAQRYVGGDLIVFRLKPEDYHRFHFPANGYAHAPIEIPGQYHAVYKKAYEAGANPIAENKRHLVLLETPHLGLISIVPTGALGVSRIVETYNPNTMVKKGGEIGYFQWGGSVVSVLVEPGKLQLRPDLITNSQKGIETIVKTGEQIAKIR